MKIKAVKRDIQKHANGSKVKVDAEELRSVSIHTFRLSVGSRKWKIINVLDTNMNGKRIVMW